MIYILIVMMVSAIATNNGLDMLIGAQQAANPGVGNCLEDSVELIVKVFIHCVKAKLGLGYKENLDYTSAPDCCVLYEASLLSRPSMERQCKVLGTVEKETEQTMHECTKSGHHLNISFCDRLSGGRQFSPTCRKYMAISGADSRRPSTAISVLLAPIVVSIAVSFSDFCPHFH